MAIHELSDYQTDCLFLLIGSNPLPNYIAARLLVKPGGKLYLVHSQGKSSTKSVAEALSRHLKAKYQLETAAYLPIYESDAYNIRNMLIEQLKKLAPTVTIGLHYTGGTKTMAVHAYRTCADWGEAERKAVVFSYLDARSMSMRIETQKLITPKQVALNHWKLAWDGKEPPSIDELLILHEEKLEKAGSEEILLIDLARQLAQVCRKPEIAKGFREWCNRDLRRMCYDNAKKDWKDEGVLQGLTVQYPAESILRNLLQQMCGTTHTGFHLETVRRHLANSQNYQGTCAELCAWLDGFWLEHYVLDCMKRVEILDGKHQLHGVQRSLEVKSYQPGSHHFELDVLALSSYRLFGISCTTSNDKAKLKLFEAMIRARQLGGDEAFVALVSCGDTKEVQRWQLQASEKWQMGTPVRVFGCADLPQLDQHLKKWFIEGE